jgi:hypothetical protein
MKLTQKFALMTPEKRPQDPHLNGKGSCASKRWNTAEVPRYDAASDQINSMPKAGPASKFRSRKVTDGMRHCCAA